MKTLSKQKLFKKANSRDNFQDASLGANEENKSQNVFFWLNNLTWRKKIPCRDVEKCENI